MLCKNRYWARILGKSSSKNTILFYFASLWFTVEDSIRKLFVTIEHFLEIDSVEFDKRKMFESNFTFHYEFSWIEFSEHFKLFSDKMISCKILSSNKKRTRRKQRKKRQLYDWYSIHWRLKLIPVLSMYNNTKLIKNEIMHRMPDNVLLMPK